MKSVRSGKDPKTCGPQTIFLLLRIKNGTQFCELTTFPTSLWELCEHLHSVGEGNAGISAHWILIEMNRIKLWFPNLLWICCTKACNWMSDIAFTLLVASILQLWCQTKARSGEITVFVFQCVWYIQIIVDFHMDYLPESKPFHAITCVHLSLQLKESLLPWLLWHFGVRKFVC